MICPPSPATLILGLILAAATVADANARDGFSRRSEKVADRVWMIYKPPQGSTEAPFEGNSVVIEQSDGLVVVDAGGSPRAGRHIVGEIRKISRKPVKQLIYTHYHGDHNLGAGALIAAWPRLRIVSTAATRANMTGPAMDYIKTYSTGNAGVVDFARSELEKSDLDPTVHEGWSDMVAVGPGMVEAYRELRAYPASVTFTDRYRIPDPVAPVEVAFLGRANTDGDAVVWLPRQKVLAAGDIVVNPVPYASASYPREWIGVLRRLKSYAFVRLIPGHGPVLRDSQYLDKLIWALETVTGAVTPLAEKGVSMEDAVKQTDLRPLARSFGGDSRWRRSMFMNFFAGAIVPNAWREARGEPIIQGKDGGG